MIMTSQKVSFVLALLFSSCWLSSAQPNIVFIYADDLDADELNCTMDRVNEWATPSGARRVVGTGKKAGVPKVLTPHIDSLAEDGLLFTRFYVNATVCTSSRYCLLTGRYATRGIELQKDYPVGSHATLEWRPAIVREETSLSKELQKLGYRTGIIGKWHNMPDKVLPKRNKKAHEPNATYADTLKYGDAIRAYYDAGLAYLSDGFGWDVVDRMEWGNSIVNLDWQCEGALKFIEESKDGPFFLYCALPVPHGQYYFDYNDVTSYDQRVTSAGVVEEPILVLPSAADVMQRTQAAGVTAKNAMATRMDDYVGAVLDKLDSLGLRENTLVIFTSDHGSRGKNSVFEGGAKVPMMAVWPGHIKAGSETDSLIGNVDIAATLIEIAGGTPPADMTLDGRSFEAQLLGQPEPRDWRTSMLIEAGNSRGIVSRNWKYVANRVPPEIEAKMQARPKEVFWTGVDHHNYQTEQMYPAYWDADQLYDLSKDLYEQQNLVGNPEYHTQLKNYQALLESAVSTLPHRFGEFGAAQ
ncbi:MAG: sulfatase-like hydrolase/transferase [Coraliomargarita sp.]|nr:sulfatase-like hydrolase/transferase [Coraliomargarita sp.]